MIDLKRYKNDNDLVRETRAQLTLTWANEWDSRFDGLHLKHLLYCKLYALLVTTISTRLCALLKVDSVGP